MGVGRGLLLGGLDEVARVDVVVVVSALGSGAVVVLLGEAVGFGHFGGWDWEMGNLT